ncbi:hypothetical protein MTR67_001619 [Solanum verrucosum]|uniref:Pentatricopeptide repeat-containing protein n=1 Tax=Solanum verrucosum TaxID=315347 RepID=A0AAF0PNK6_SOLVR|nr:hypothetical protein MTR67_001619 [Solanum verrucosum]
MIGTGGSLHSMAVKSGFGSNLHVNNTLLRMYAGFGVISGIELHVELETALLGMYAKCSHIQQAFRIFNSMGDKNLQTWTIMISGLAVMDMEKNHIFFVDVGREYFEKMASIYNIRPTMEHYRCMVDMFGRAGELEEAYDIIRSMPIEPNFVILRSFISACKHHGHIPCAEENIREILLKIEHDLKSNYVLASSLSYLFGYCSDANNLRLAMKAKGIKKYPGSSWVQSFGSSSEVSG